MGDHHNHGNLRGKKLAISILLNIFITIVQAIGGLVSGSLSLVSDALHNFSDVVALIISYIADKLSQKKYTPQETFGYKRIEVLAALINAATLIAIAIMLAKEAVVRFNEVVEINSVLVMVLAALSIVVNGVSVILLKKDSQDNMNIKSAYLHLLSDMISSVAVLAGGIAMYCFNIFWVDSVLCMAIALYLIYSSCGLLVRTLRVLMQFAPTDIDLQEVTTAILQISSIKNVHHVHIWQLNDNNVHFEAHLDFNDNLNLSQVSVVIKEVNNLLKEKFHINHTILQPEFAVEDAKDLIVED